MKKTPDDSTPTGATMAPKANKHGLRLVTEGDAAEPVPPADALPRVKKKSNLASFFTAYADAIDRDVQAILDL